MPTTCLVCVMPVSRTPSKYFSTSFTGSTGSLHEMKITVKGLAGIAPSRKPSYRKVYSSGSSLLGSSTLSTERSKRPAHRISALSWAA